MDGGLKFSGISCRGRNLKLESSDNCDNDFKLLLGRTFLRQLAEGKTEEAIAYGRALLALMDN